MAKFSGLIGFVGTREDPPNSGIWEEFSDARQYYGDILRQGRHWEHGDSRNDDLTVNNYISIIADDFAKQNFQFIKWVEILGVKWRISSVEIEYPRIKLTLGGVWNG